MSEVAPKVYLRSFTSITGGTDTPGTFGGAEITTTNGGTGKNAYFVEDDFLHPYTVTNPSGNTDITGYPNLSRSDDYEGADVVILTRGAYKTKLNLNYTTYVAPDVKSVVGISEADTYIRYSFDWLTGLFDNEGSLDVYAGAARNPACWAASLDLTGIPYTNTSGGSRKNSGLITRRHLPGVAHYPMAVGTEVIFKTAENANISRTIIGVSASSDLTGDALVYVFDSDLPESIKSYPVPGRWLFITSEDGAVFTVGNQFCSLFINQDRKIYGQIICHYGSESQAKKSGSAGGVEVADAATTLHFNALLYSQRPPEADSYPTYFGGARVGDSGSAIFVPVASGLALASVFTTVAGGPFMDEDFVNALILSANDDAVSNGFTRPPDYTVTVAPDPTA